MNKIYLFVLALLMLFFQSCSNKEIENYSQSNDVNNVNSELLIKMTSFNDSILQTRGVTRGFVKPGMYKRARVIAGDIEGAISTGGACFWAGSFAGPQAAIGCGFLGGLIGGVSGSWLAYREQYWTRANSLTPEDLENTKEKTIAAYASMISNEEEVMKFTPKEIRVDYPVKDENITLMGTKHNFMLKKLISNETIDLNISNKLSKEQVKFLNSKEFNDAISGAMKNISKNLKDGNQMKSKGDGLTAKVMNLFYEILAKYPDNLNDIEFIINKYIEAIDATKELSNNEKKIIYAGLSVAASSSEFWLKNY